MTELAVSYPGAARTDSVVVRKIGLADVWASLAAGWADFLAVPTQLVFLCILYPVVGLIAGRAAFHEDVTPLLFPLVAGLSLLGPVLAVGVYELSRRREAGLSVSWLNAFDVLRSPSLLPIAAVGLLLFVIFLIWLMTAQSIFQGTVGQLHPASFDDFVAAAVGTTAGLKMFLLGNIAGLVFAAVVLSLTVVSVPMLLDRTRLPFLAIQTSMRAVAMNPVPMAAWGVTVAVVLLLGCLPVFMGLAVAMPVLGHATWHLYRKLVG